MTSFFVIFNPAARGERSRRVRQFLDSRPKTAVTLAPTERPGDAKRLAAQAVTDGYGLIIAAGGDGTINEVVNGIGLSGVPLGILPGGTVNVLAQDLKIPRRLDAAWSMIEQGLAKVVDLAQAEFGGQKRFFLQLAGVGFDARAVRAASWELKKRIGPLSYIWAGLQTLNQPHAHVDVSVNGDAPHAGGVAVLVGNGRFYGGPFKLFPKASMEDGLLDVCVFERGGYLDMLRYGQGILRAAHVGFRDVQYFQAKEFTCSAAQPVPFQLDGEDAGDAPVRFSVVPRALRVIVPALTERNSHA